MTAETTPQGEVNYTYDNARRRLTMSVPGQAQTAYAWDNANRLTGITQGTSAVGFSYDTANRRTQLTLPNGVTLAYTYDQDSHVTGITYSAGSTQLGGLTYSYDADGRRTATGGSLAATGMPTAVSGNTFNADNAMTGFNGATLSYDANGNLTSDGANSYTWDARNHLTAIGGANVASFVYDAFGRRMAKTIGALTTDYLYDGLNPVEELQGGAASANILTGLGIDEYFLRSDSSGAMALLADALGSTIGLVNSGGSIATSYTYQPFGATTVSGMSNANPYQFTGRESDGTGLYFYRARYYHPAFQRFVSQDPIGFGGGDTDLYAFVKNDPATLIDRVGLQVVPPYADPGSPDYNPDLVRALNNLDNTPSITPYPPGEPGYRCAPPPPRPSPKCVGSIGAKGVGLLAGSGFIGGYEAFGPIGSAIVGSVTTVGAAWLAAQCGEQ